MNLHARLIALAETCEQSLAEIGGMADRRGCSHAASDVAESIALLKLPDGLSLYGALRFAVSAIDRITAELEAEGGFPEPLKREDVDGI
jgi:hypothetical protein